MPRPALLQAGDPPPYTIEHAGGSSAFFLCSDHAGRAFPRRLGTLGLADRELDRHIAWDIGIAGVARAVAGELDAFLIMQNYSRLVIDANRAPGSPQSIVRVSERTQVPGNAVLTAEEIAEREHEIFAPYHERIREELDRRNATGQPTVIVALHSFTPVFMDRTREWDAGVLYNRDRRVARVMLELLRGEPELQVGDNQPYAVSDATDYTVVVHGEQRGLPHVELEIRQDLIAELEGQRQWANRLARLLTECREHLPELFRI